MHRSRYLRTPTPHVSDPATSRTRGYAPGVPHNPKPTHHSNHIQHRHTYCTYIYHHADLIPPLKTISPDLTSATASSTDSHTFFFFGTTSSGAAVLYALRPTPHGSAAACECAWGRPALRSVPVAFRAGSPRRTVLDGIAQIVRRTVCIFLKSSRYRLRGIGAGVFPPEIPGRRGGLWVGHKFESTFLSKSDSSRTGYVARG